MNRKLVSTLAGRAVLIACTLCVGGLCLTAPVASAALPAATMLAPTPIDLGSLGGYSSNANAVSGNLVVGHSWLEGNDTYHAFVYDLGAATPVMKDLGTFGGSRSDAIDVSGDVVVGWADAADGRAHAFVYDLGASSPVMKDLGTLGGPASSACAIDGQLVVGSALSADGDSHAFAYDLGAATPMMKDLGTLGGPASRACAVDGAVAVGRSNIANAGTGEPEHAFAYDLSAASPQMRDLGTLGYDSDALAVSGDIVVGWSYPGNSLHHSFTFDLGAVAPKMKDMGTFGGLSNLVYDVDGDIAVGTSDLTEAGYSPRHAYVYDVGSDSPTLRDIGTIGDDTNSAAYAIDGDIVVGGSYNPGPIETNADHAFAYDLSAEMISLGTVGGNDSWAYDVSGML